MKLSLTVAYALQATILLARSGTNTPTPCSQLAAEGQMPGRFLLQVLRSLVNHGILHSTRGVEGGYVLYRRPEEISLLQIIEAVGGPLNSSLPIGDGLPENCQEHLMSVLNEVTEDTRTKLGSIRLSTLIDASNQQSPSTSTASTLAPVFAPSAVVAGLETLPEVDYEPLAQS